MMGCDSRIISNVVVGSVGADVSVGVVVSLTSLCPSLRSSRRCLGLGLPWVCSCSYSFVVDCVSTFLAGCFVCVGCSEAVEGCGSSSHSMLANSANRRFADRGGSVGLLGYGAARPRGGNIIVRYCCIIGLSFLPAWYAFRPSRSAAPVITPESTTRLSKLSMMIPTFCFGIL